MVLLMEYTEQVIIRIVITIMRAMEFMAQTTMVTAIIIKGGELWEQEQQ